MKTVKHILLVLLVALSWGGFAACSKSEDDKGSMERAGRTVDEAMNKAKEQTGQAMEKAGEAMRQAGERMRQGAEKEKK
jgi:hypothetical protein